MVVLTALSAALFAAILIPFKVLPIIPGVTEIRPANAIPIVCSLLFGPAGAWGSAFGNLIGDFFLGLGPGSLFGMVGNFLYGFVPYAFWRTMFGNETPQAGRKDHWMGLIFICLVASAACAFSIAWGIDVVIQGVPFAVLGIIIFFNNFLMSILLAPPLLFALLPRVNTWRLRYTQVLPDEATRRPKFAWLGIVLMTLGAVGGLGGGLMIATGLYDEPLGVPQLFKAIQRASVPVAAKAPLAESKSPAALRPAVGSSTVTVRSSQTREPANPRSASQKALAFGLIPALGLMALGFLLL